VKLLLFDIDGTLLDSGEAGTRSLNLAFEEVFSIRNAFRGISMAGKTDIQIMKEGLRKHGLSSVDGNVARLCESYIRNLRVQVENPMRHLKPGILETLTMLKKEDIPIGLLTGNIETGARIKLSPFGLNDFFDLGAFGSDDEDRNRLLPIVVERFREKYKRDMGYSDCVVIGDTPRDVECAKIYGATAIAVATGPYSYESLLRTGADMVLRNITEMDCNFLKAQKQEQDV